MNVQDVADALLMAAEINEQIASGIAGGAEISIKPNGDSIEVVVGEASEVISLGRDEGGELEGEVAS
jgi:hypothetical protein